MIPAPGDVITTKMMRIVTPLERGRRPTKFREWSVHEPVIVTAVAVNRFGNTILTFAFVRTVQLWTYEIRLTPDSDAFKLLMAGVRASERS